MAPLSGPFFLRGLLTSATMTFEIVRSGYVHAGFDRELPASTLIAKTRTERLPNAIDGSGAEIGRSAIRLRSQSRN